MTTRLTSRIPPRLVRRLRGAWVALALFIFITWIPRILARFSSMPPDDGLALLSRIVEVFTFAMFAAVALTLYWRRGDDWLALFTGMMLLLTAYGYTGSRLSGTDWAFASFFLVVLMEFYQVTFFYIFPDGKFLPRRAKYGVVPLFIFRFLIWENIYRNSLPQRALEVGGTAGWPLRTRRAKGRASGPVRRRHPPARRGKPATLSAVPCFPNSRGEMRQIAARAAGAAPSA